MPPATLSPRQMRIFEITPICLLVIMIGFGVFYQFAGLKLDGNSLVLVGILIVGYVNLFRFKLAQASERIDQLEKKLVEIHQQTHLSS
jgi:hypothetical protein